jgi:hypothetical protein
MSDGASVGDRPTSPLQTLGGQGVVCIGDSCEVPQPSGQAIVNEMIDSGAF